MRVLLVPYPDTWRIEGGHRTQQAQTVAFWIVDASRTQIWQYDSNTVYVPFKVAQRFLKMDEVRDENGKINAPDVKAGDTVLFGKWSGTEVKIDGDELLIMKEADIMGVIA